MLQNASQLGRLLTMNGSRKTCLMDANECGATPDSSMYLVHNYCYIFGDNFGWSIRWRSPKRVGSELELCQQSKTGQAKPSCGTPPKAALVQPRVCNSPRRHDKSGYAGSRGRHIAPRKPRPRPTSYLIAPCQAKPSQATLG